jgi:hypothetical protein
MSTDSIDQTIAARFADLAARWCDDSEPMAYREIIAMGEPAIKLILAELESRPAPWFDALKALTGEDPVPPEARGNVGAMTEIWLAWGRQEAADRAEALRIMPGSERLTAAIARRPASTIDYSQEDDELPC